MDEPRIAMLAMRPGSHDVVEVRGTARVCTDGPLLESMRVRDRTPKVALVIDVDHLELRNEPALSAADLWNPSRHIADDALPRAATIWADHVRRNTDSGTGAKVARRLANKTAIAAGVAYDYRTNLCTPNPARLEGTAHRDSRALSRISCVDGCTTQQGLSTHTNPRPRSGPQPGRPPTRSEEPA
jgi:hypothetical protein